MNIHRKSMLAIVLVALALSIYFAPHFTVMQIRSAAASRNAVALSSYVDFPALKANLKADLSNRVSSGVFGGKGYSIPAAFGAVMTGALVNPVIDLLVTPDNLALTVRGNTPRPGRTGADSFQPNATLEMAMSYESFDRFVVAVRKKGDMGEPIEFVLSRDNFIFWKLSAIHLPL